jgi:hypothetical protein
MNDLLLESTNDPAIFDMQVSGGDFLSGDSEAQRILLILMSSKGSFKQAPLVGVGGAKIINGILDAATRREIQLQLEGDGIFVKSIEASSSGFKITT